MASHSYTAAAPKNLHAWLPALFGIAVICGESTNTMGANHTAIWLSELATWAGHPNGPLALLNHLLRKSGHFTGYGLLGVCFARAWYSVLRRHVVAGWSALRLRAGLCGVLSACVVASADEIHQIFLPTRGASVWDVLLDTSGALVLNAIFFALLAARRNALLHPQSPFTTLGLSVANLPGTQMRARVRYASSQIRRHAYQTSSSLFVPETASRIQP